MNETDTSARSRQEQLAIAALLTLAGLVFFYALQRFYPIGVDWEASYYQGIRHVRRPYDGSSFAGFPWVFFFLPHALLNLPWGNAINFCLNISVPVAVIRRFKGGWQAMVLVFASPIFLDLARTNNVEWVPLLGFLLPMAWGLPFLAAKPQTIGGAALVWWKRQKFAWRPLVPMLAMLVVGVVIWQTQPLEKVSVQGFSTVAWNFAPWPYAIPLGLYLLYRGYRQDDEVLAAAATPFLVPYFAPYSLVPLLVLLACRHRREALYVNLGFWLFLLVESRRMGILLGNCGC